MNRGIWFFVLMITVIVAVASVSAIPQTLNIHGRLSNSTTSAALTAAYDMNFSIYDAYEGGTALYVKSLNVDPDGSGVYNVILDDVNLNFSEQYYLGIKVEGDNEMTPRINLTSSPYAYMAQNVSVGGITYDGNVDMGANNLTTTGYGWFGLLGEIGNRITKLWVDEVNATGNIVTSGNVSADYFIGDGSLLTGVASETGWVNDSTSTNTSLNVNIGSYYGSDNELSVQSNNANSWLEILNSGGAGKGALLGIFNNVFQLYNWQGGDIEFYTNTSNSTGELRMTIENSGDVIVAESLDVGGTMKTDIINSSSSGNVTITSVGGSVIVKLG